MSDGPLERLRSTCLGLPEVTERLSHGEPTFFVGKRVFAMFANNHHDDGHVGVWLPAPERLQASLIAGDPEAYYRPPYVGARGWIGVELARIGDEDLRFHIETAWQMVAPK